MKRISEKIRKHNRRKIRVRKKIFGTPEKPRMSVFKSNKFTYVQVIDDTKGHTLVAVSNKEKELADVKNTVETIGKIGEVAAAKLKEKNIDKIVFDRNGNKYHGLIKAIADAVRKGGIQF